MMKKKKWSYKRWKNEQVLIHLGSRDAWLHLQVGQQVAGLSHSGPGGVQLDLQLLLSLPQAADLRLRRAQVLLALPHQLLQVGHLRYHSSGEQGRGQ